MKRALPLLLATLFALPLSAAGRRAEKRVLIDEVLQLMDAKALTQAALGRFFTTFEEAAAVPEELSEEQRAEYEKVRKARQEEMRVFQERMFSRLDYPRIAEEIYVPLFDRTFSEDDLRELIVFLNTKSGQKLVSVMPDLGLAAFIEGRALLEEAVVSTQNELHREEREKNPVHATMADMRSLATALEARATDTNEYPISDLDSLPALLEPTYIRRAPLVDGWGTPFLYVSDGMQYRIVSAGADKRFEWSARQLAAGDTQTESHSLDADIIFEEGTFLQYPKEALQQE